MNPMSLKERQIEESAAEWFVLIHSGEASEQELKEFYAWLQASDAHIESYKEYSELWDELPEMDMPAAAPIELEDQPDFSEEESIAETKVRKSIALRVVSYFDNATSWAYGAVAMTLFIGMFLFTEMNTAKEEATLYTTHYGEIRDIELADGSKVTLSAKSRLSVSLEEDIRELHLHEGQAFFDVASQFNAEGSKVPFVIHSGDMRVRVVGTQFDIRLLEDKAHVTVTEGVVEVDNHREKDQPVKVVAGQQIAAIGPKFENVTMPQEVNVDDIVSWKMGWLSYRDAKLGDVLTDARRFHEGRITLGKKELEDLRITTSFRVDQVEQMTNMLEGILPVKVYRESNKRIVILPRSMQ